ncbi:MAG: Flp pilus assembly complex ATPase component TadA [Candidatus Omnitrophica bacterium]|nr:Flp pilus assembly complex ATPase component TadA [Candidatus Omnitrophota bacterium]
MTSQARVGEFLLRNKIISEEQLAAVYTRQKQSQSRFIDELFRADIVPEQVLLEKLGEAMQMPVLRLLHTAIDESISEKVPARYVTHYNFVPVREDNGCLVIAISDPFDVFALDEIKLLLKMPLTFVLSLSTDIADAIKRCYGVGAKTMAQMVEASLHMKVLSAAAPETGVEEADDHSVIKFLDQIIQHAVIDRATDIHIEPYEAALRVRYRIDGLLYDVPVPPSIQHFYSAIMIRVKIMASLDIAEKRLPQDGRIQVKIDAEDYDLRVSILPSAFGESVVIRILSRKQVFYALEQLGVDQRELHILNTMIKRPHGIILVTGPTGSGKTTTLYSCLQKINSAERKIITIEDPIEYKLFGITQVQVQAKIHLTFANGLRSMLRHDPDIMMVGEIRDLETAELAIRTALTGHLVFSTLHTNDAAGSIARLLDMGIEPYLVSSSLSCLIAQRLVRVICPQCRQPYQPHAEIMREFKVSALEWNQQQFRQGRGCETCKFTGFFGRTAIFEIMELNDALREMILNRTPSNVIKQRAIAALGMKTLRQSGWEKIVRGETTPEEVLRVTQEDIE